MSSLSVSLSQPRLAAVEEPEVDGLDCPGSLDAASDERDLGDVALMRRLLEDPHPGEAMRQLVGRYQDELVGYFYNHCWDQLIAEELAQTVFIKVYRARDRYQPTAKFRTYLYRIAYNAMIDHFRRRKHHLSLDAEVGNEGSGRSFGDLLEGGIDSQREARQLLIQRRVQQAVETLSEGHRQVFVLANHQGLKYEEIGAILDIPEGTVKSRMHAAVRKLRVQLADLLDLVDN